MISESSAHRIREESVSRAKSLGIELRHEVPPVISTFGELDLRPANIRVARVIAIYAVLCVVFEPKKKRAGAKVAVLKWLERFDLVNSLTDEEFSFISGGNCLDADGYGEYVEALYAIAWTLGLVQKMSPREDVDSNFGEIFPNILMNTDPGYLFKEACSRSQIEVLKELDLYYCFHWLSVEAELGRRAWALPIGTNVVRYRRLGLEWALSQDSWEHISLDT